MQTQRTILWVIFSMSMLFLWDAWQKSTGQPSLLGGLSGQSAPGSTPAPVGAPGAAAGTTAAVPPAAAGSASAPPAAGVAGSAPASAATVAPAGQLVRITSDLLALDIDTVGGVIRKAELLTHKDPENKKNFSLLESKPGNFFIAETGVIGSANQVYANQSTAFTVEQGQRDLGNSDQVQLKLTAQTAAVKIVKTITLKKGSYEVLVSHDITNIRKRT